MVGEPDSVILDTIRNESVMRAQINGASSDPATWPTYAIKVVFAAGCSRLLLFEVTGSTVLCCHLVNDLVFAYLRLGSSFDCRHLVLTCIRIIFISYRMREFHYILTELLALRVVIYLFVISFMACPHCCWTFWCRNSGDTTFERRCATLFRGALCDTLQRGVV